MGKGGAEQRARTSFPRDPRDCRDPRDPRAFSKKLVFDDPSMLFSTFGPQEWPEGALEPLGLIFLEKLSPEAAPHAHTLLLFKRGVNVLETLPPEAAPHADPILLFER